MSSPGFREIPVLFLLFHAFFFRFLRLHFRTSSGSRRLPAGAPACTASTADRSAQAGSLSPTYLAATRQAGETERVSVAICVRHVFSILAFADLSAARQGVTYPKCW